MDRHDDYQWHDQYNQVADPSTIDIRDLLNDEWEFMTKPDFNPVPLALELMDGSSLGKDYDMFCMILRSIEGALKAVVDGSYQGFNASIGTYGGVIDSITDSQSRVKELRMDLKNSKESLRLRHADLIQLYNKSQQYKDMIEMLDEIEELKQVPEKLETLIREKHFLAAVKLLVSASKTIAKPEMVSVGALSDLTRFLNEQLESMAEMLMEELHNHLYLKSPYCDSRWATYTTGQEALPSAERGLFDGLGKDKLGTLSSDRLKRSGGFQPKSKPGNEVRLDDEMITEDLEVNPEVDSAYYLEILVESLGLLGKFKDAIVTILQRVPLETYQLIDKTIGEVNERRNAAALKTMNTRDSNFDDEDDEKYLATKNNENEILRDLFWTLFSKLECVTQGHSTVLIAGQRLLRRAESDHVKSKEMGLAGVKMYSFAEVWTPMLTEIRCLLSDYLMDTNQGDDGLDIFMGGSGSGHDSGSDLLRSRKANRDKNRQLFKFTDSIGGSSLCKVYDNEIGVFATEPLRKALPQVYAQMNEQGPSLAFSGLIQDKYAEVLANHPIAALNPDGKGSGSSSSQSGSNGTGTGTGGSSSSSKKAAAATANSVPLIPGYLKAAQNGVTGWKNPALLNGSSATTTTNNQLQTSASGHQSLVRADPAHISVVIRPAVAFVERIRESVPLSREDGTVVVGAFFDHGVINVPMGRF
ncbi:hypothetical protein BGZ97_000598 [Linnemannia gamsii]|uniref:Exocyst complex component Sec8 n=1 Tax=Linnemannia gamsii TaxID=64522 RepID=A0A9P6RH60_9FUNG|nr:hypothetical protein BGZ97_000598 [Linnemannia gamsii]